MTDTQKCMYVHVRVCLQEIHAAIHSLLYYIQIVLIKYFRNQLTHTNTHICTASYNSICPVEKP